MVSVHGHRSPTRPAERRTWEWQKQQRTPCAGCEELQAAVTRLEEQLAAARKDSSTSSKPPSSDIVRPPPPPPPPGQDKRKRGGQPGHPKHERAPFPHEQID